MASDQLSKGGFDDNPFQVASADKAYQERTTQGAVETRKSELQRGAGQRTSPSAQRLQGAAEGPGRGGIGRDVPQRNFNLKDIRPPTWFSNKDHAACVCCKIPFTTFNRRHHCRGCGLIFCKDCTPEKLLLPMSWNLTEPERVCGTCARSLVHVQHELRPQYSKTTPRKDSFATTKWIFGVK